MLPYDPGGHAAYQDTFVSDFLKFYPDPFVLSKDTWEYIIQFWYLNLSPTDSIMQECYSGFGHKPRLASCMLRSYLLALKLKVASITQWCRMLCESMMTVSLFVRWAYACIGMGMSLQNTCEIPVSESNPPARMLL